MNSHDWRSLPIWDQSSLYDGLDVDQVDYPNLSVRWTGSLTAAVTGNYTLTQMRQLLQDPVMKVWIAGQLALDSTPSEDNPNNARYHSSPVQLTAGSPVDFRVELSHAFSGKIEYSLGAPLAVLAWESQNVANELIPRSAYSPPEGFAEPGVKGLKGQYFSGPNFDISQLKATRLDPGIEFVWPSVPVVPLYGEELDSILESCAAKLASDAFLGGLNEEEILPFLERACWPLSHRLPLSKRRDLLIRLVSQPKLMEAMSPYAMGNLMESVHMLPGKEHLELLRVWSLTRPQPRAELGLFSGKDPGSYQWNNLHSYWLIGNFMQGPYWSDVERLWANHLRRPDGECNLAICYATAFATEMEGKGNILVSLLREGADDQTLPGDKRLTWLLGLAFAEGALVDGEPQPMRGFKYLEEAIMVAESPEYRFWALQEMVARLGSLDEGKRAKELIDRYQDEFATKAPILAAWRQKIDELSAKYVEIRNTPSTEFLEAYIATLEERLAGAQGRADQQDVARYQALLAQASSLRPPTE
jgi:hypothetical protein